MYYEDNVVLCVSNAYEKKFYMNPDFNGLPDHIKKELKIMCRMYRVYVLWTIRNCCSGCSRLCWIFLSNKS